MKVKLFRCESTQKRGLITTIPGLENDTGAWTGQLTDTMLGGVDRSVDRVGEGGRRRR